MSQYRAVVQQMIEAHKEQFDNFKDIHDNYAMNPDEWQKLFNEYGKEIMDLMREYERKLLVKMGTGRYGQFSTGVSDKFWNEIRKIFPKIDFVGVQRS